MTQCVATVGQWNHRCYREAVEEIDGRWYCRPHGAGRRRTIANNERIDQEIAADNRTRDALFAQAARLSAALGTRVEPDYVSFGKGSWTGKMVVSAAFLVKLAGIIEYE